MIKKRKKIIYRAVIIGSGNIGALLEADPLRPKPATYAGAFSRHPDIRLVGLMDRSVKVLQKARLLFPAVSTYDQAEECLKREQPDIVAISTPPNSHYLYLRLCKKYKVTAVICEKPICHSLLDARRMQRLAKDSKMIILVNHQRRFFELFRRAQKKIQSGRLGRVRQITAYYSNGMLNNGSHIIDALRFLLQDEIVSVIGARNSKNETHPKGDYNIDGICFFRKGAVATIQSFDQNTYGIHEIRIMGDKGALLINKYGFEFNWSRVGAPRLFAGIRELENTGQIREKNKVGMVKGVVDHLVSCIHHLEKPLSTIGDATEDLVVLSALIKSAKSDGRRILIEHKKII